MVQLPYVRFAKGLHEVTCDHTQFKGVADPAPGVKKQCFCDNDGFYNDTQYQQDMATFKAQALAEQRERELEKQKEATERAAAAAVRARLEAATAAENAAKEEAQRRAEADRERYEQEKRALEDEKAAREAAYQRNLAEQDKAQAKELLA